MSTVDTCYVVAYSAQAAIDLFEIYQTCPDEMAILMIRQGYVSDSPESAERHAKEFKTRMVGLPWDLHVWEMKSGVFIP